MIATKVPAVSWLICSNINDETLRCAINSCLDQSFSDFELVFVANGPSASEIAESVNLWFGEDSRLIVLQTEIRYLSFSLSYGLHHARAELIARMDSDDIALRDRLKRQVDYMISHPEVHVLGSAYEIIDDEGKIIYTKKMPLIDKDIRRGFIRGNPLCHPSVMFRRQVVVEAGGYLGYLFAEDYDLWVRLARQPNIKFANLPDVCLQYRLSSNINSNGISRGSTESFASVAASQFRCYLLGYNPILWGIASLFSVIKAIFSKKIFLY